MCYYFDFKVSMYEKKSNCPYELSASLSHLSTTYFLHTLNLVRLNLHIFLLNLFKKRKHEFNLICGSEKRACICLTANLRNFTKHFHYRI